MMEEADDDGKMRFADVEKKSTHIPFPSFIRVFSCTYSIIALRLSTARFASCTQEEERCKQASSQTLDLPHLFHLFFEFLFPFYFVAIFCGGNRQSDDRPRREEERKKKKHRLFSRRPLRMPPPTPLPARTTLSSLLSPPRNSCCRRNLFFFPDFAAAADGQCRMLNGLHSGRWKWEGWGEMNWGQRREKGFFLALPQHLSLLSFSLLPRCPHSCSLR